MVYSIAYLLLDLFFSLVSKFKKKKKREKNNEPFEFFLNNFKVKIQNFNYNFPNFFYKP